MSDPETSYFGLWSAKKLKMATDLLQSLGVRYEVSEYQTTTEILQDWEAFDPEAATTNVGWDLFIYSADLDKVGQKLVEMFPERKFGG